jgi:hypothetical protein
MLLNTLTGSLSWKSSFPRIPFRRFSAQSMWDPRPIAMKTSVKFETLGSQKCHLLDSLIDWAGGWPVGTSWLTAVEKVSSASRTSPIFHSTNVAASSGPVMQDK